MHPVNQKSSSGDSLLHKAGGEEGHLPAALGACCQATRGLGLWGGAALDRATQTSRGPTPVSAQVQRHHQTSQRPWGCYKCHSLCKSVDTVPPKGHSSPGTIKSWVGKQETPRLFFVALFPDLSLSPLFTLCAQGSSPGREDSSPFPN